jgi:hypothetical protein
MKDAAELTRQESRPFALERASQVYCLRKPVAFAIRARMYGGVL